ELHVEGQQWLVDVVVDLTIDLAPRKMRVHRGRLEIEAHPQRAPLLRRGLPRSSTTGEAGGKHAGGHRAKLQKIPAVHVRVRCGAAHAMSSLERNVRYQGRLWPGRRRRSPVAWTKVR